VSSPIYPHSCMHDKTDLTSNVFGTRVVKYWQHILKLPIWLVVAYRRCPSLNDILTSSRLTRQVNRKGSHTCGNCYLCTSIITSECATSTSNSFSLRITQSINCKTTGIIYLITCKKCNKQYIGESGNSANLRFRGHDQDIRENLGFKPVSNHFNLAGHSRSDVTITLLRKIQTGEHNRRKRAEDVLIRQFGTYFPVGLNIKEH
jgi:hypothetical protein